MDYKRLSLSINVFPSVLSDVCEQISNFFFSFNLNHYYSGPSTFIWFFSIKDASRFLRLDEKPACLISPNSTFYNLNIVKYDQSHGNNCA